MWRKIFEATDWLRHRARLRSWNTAQAWGRRGEDIAHRYLQAAGYIVVARNYRTRGGSAEVDIIARQGTAIVFVEVKTRATEDFGPPDRAVDSEKQEHIFRAASEYLRRAELPWNAARFDIISVVSGANTSIRHIHDAFQRIRPL